MIPILALFGAAALVAGLRPPGWGVQAEEGEPEASVRLAVRRAYHSVVRVEVEGERIRGDAPRRRLFREVQARDGGAGFVVAPHYVLTHSSLAPYEQQGLTVTTAAGTRYEARLVHVDPRAEVAVLRVDQRLDAPSLELGSSESLSTGNLVVALGDPFGTARDAQATASLGVLEGRTRLDAREVAVAGEVLLTDAAINPGSEGGPLLDLQGRVVGVLAPLARDRRTRALHGHAIPIEVARRVLEEARQRRAPRLGFAGRDAAGGVLVVTVRSRGAAARAGLKSGDLIQGVAGRRVRTRAEMREVLAGFEDDELELEVERDGQVQRLTVTLEEER